MIICFEGPSAIGKTSMCDALANDYNVVPEVNILFKREATAGELWYFEKQAERYQLCTQSSQTSILDGDVFQPIWYNWIYNYPPEFPSKATTHTFFRQLLKDNKIDFPDLYIVFQVDEIELRKRKETDPIRKRRNFEKHLQLIEPQRQYFNFIKEHTEIPVIFIDYLDMASTKEKVCSVIEKHQPIQGRSIEAFEKIIKWL